MHYPYGDFMKILKSREKCSLNTNMLTIKEENKVDKVPTKRKLNNLIHLFTYFPLKTIIYLHFHKNVNTVKKKENYAYKKQ